MNNNPPKTTIKDVCQLPGPGLASVSGSGVLGVLPYLAKLS